MNAVKIIYPRVPILMNPFSSICCSTWIMNTNILLEKQTKLIELLPWWPHPCIQALLVLTNVSLTHYFSANIPRSGWHLCNRKSLIFFNIACLKLQRCFYGLLNSLATLQKEKKKKKKKSYASLCFLHYDQRTTFRWANQKTVKLGVYILDTTTFHPDFLFKTNYYICFMTVEKHVKTPQLKFYFFVDYLKIQFEE